MGQNIVENQQQTLRQQPQSAQNEFDYYPQEQIAPQQISTSGLHLSRSYLRT